ncbi:hypothetical protein HW115_11055 [Verrucomicrobiaceae bacterium N1E253]|uniref:Uncharacterized protein n=1 Tax=Oceaniferula marina TaxID=2748318 RepID=A0A851GG13_9BACT|nr:hypothetical protein [Oceaniferula marina]NWK56149.1 hypothetical protein [Oceaniferula marina]
MDQEPSPYQVSQSGMSPVVVPELPPAQGTSLPKVFGIIHICYAILGGIMSLVGIASLFFIRAMVEKGGEEFQQLQPMLDAFDGMKVYIYVDAGVKWILAVMLLVAGIGLLKRKAWAPKLSQVWAVVRIVLAIGMMVWGMFVTAHFQESMVELQNESQAGIHQLSQGVGNVMNIVFVCVYPVLCLIFLSKKVVRDAMKRP